MRVRSALVPLLSALCLIAALWARPLHADVIRLVSGEELACRPLPRRSDESKLVVKDLKTGSFRTLSWDDVDARDRARLRGTLWDPLRTQRGQWLWVRMAAGDSDLIVGLKESEKAGTLLLRRADGMVPIPMSTVLEGEDDELDARDVWSTAQLMERLAHALVEHDPTQSLRSAQGRVAFRVGEFAEWAGALEEARDAFRRAAADPAFADRAVAGERARRVEALLAAPGLAALLQDFRARVRRMEFAAAQSGLADYVSAHPELGEAARAALADVQSEADAKRDRVLGYVARHEFPGICRRLIEAKVKEGGLSLEAARAWAKKDLADAAFAALAKRMAAWHAVDARPYWEARREESGRSPWLRASYGSGSFIVYPAKILPPRVPARGPAPVALPVPPTPEAWWTTHAAERAPWLMASCVNASGLFEVAEATEQVPCAACQGEGIKELKTRTGATVTYLCDRCAGTRFDYTVLFR